MQNLKTISVIGAGQMGNGIAHVLALAGYQVLLHDVSRERIEQGLGSIRHNIARQVAKGIVSSSDQEAALKRIEAAETLADVGQADLVIEAATEKEAVKRKIFQDLTPDRKSVV